MDNVTRRELLTRHRQSQFPGSILDVFKAYDQGVDLIGEFEQQQMQVAQTPQQQQQGLRPAHQAGNVNQSMAFPNVAPNTPFNTMGMKAPIDIKKFDEQGHLVKSYDNVPPGVQNLPTGPQRGTVIETPARMQDGGEKLDRLPSFTATAESTSQPMSAAELAFLNPPAEQLNRTATISQGNFDVDEDGKIIEDKASVLDMMANPMTTLRTVVDPSVEGRPSQLEFDKAATKGSVVGQAANDLVNPAAWVNYGKNALRDASQGNFIGAGLNALGAVPGISITGGGTRQALKHAGVTGVKDLYKANPALKNPMGFRNVGDKPHFLFGYNKPVDPLRMDLSKSAGFDELLKKEEMIKLQQENIPSGPQWAQRFRDAEADLYTKTPFGEYLGSGSFGTVHEFKNSPYAIKFPHPELHNNAVLPTSRYSGTTDDFIARTSEIADDMPNVAAPLRSQNDLTIMRNLQKQEAVPGASELPTRDAYASALKQVRQLRDRGIGLDLDNIRGNINYNKNTGQFDFYDLENVPHLSATSPKNLQQLNVRYGPLRPYGSSKSAKAQNQRGSYTNPIEYMNQVQSGLGIRGKGFPDKLTGERSIQLLPLRSPSGLSFKEMQDGGVASGMEQYAQYNNLNPELAAAVASRPQSNDRLTSYTDAQMRQFNNKGEQASINKSQTNMSNRLSTAGSNAYQFHKDKPLDALGMDLAIAGQVPLVGEVADLANAGISGVRGIYNTAVGDTAKAKEQFTLAGLSAASAIPFAGNAVGAARLAKTGHKIAHKAHTLEKGVIGAKAFKASAHESKQRGGFKGSDLERAIKVGAGAAATSTIGRGMSALARNRNLDKDAFAQWKAGQDRAHQALLGMDYDEYCLTGDCPENPFQGDPPNFRDWRNHDYFSASQTNARPVGRLVQGFEENPLQGKSILKQGVKDGILTGVLTYGTNKLLDNTRFGRKVKRNFNVKVGWNGRRQNGGPRKMQSGNFAFDSELLKAGIAGTESSNGVRSQMINPESTATGLYGQRFSEIKDTYPNSRSEFSTNIAAQDSIFDKRLYEGLNGERSMLDHLDHMYTNYADQIEKKGHTSNHVGGIINMLGREGTRRYYGLVVRDGKSLEEVFPTKYGPKAKIKNKTPDEYADSMQEWIDRYKEKNCKGEECGKKKLGGPIRKYFKLRK